MDCGLGGEPAEEHWGSAPELCYGWPSSGNRDVQVSRLLHAWKGAQGFGRGGVQLTASWAGPRPGLHVSDFNE